MRIIANPYRRQGLPDQDGFEQGSIVTDPKAALALMSECPIAHTTPVTNTPDIANDLGIAELYIKDERGRMGLGSFKALGAAFAIAKQSSSQMSENPGTSTKDSLKGTTFVCASAGNHGLSMAAGARVFGASAVVYLSETVPESFAEKLRSKGARVVREGADYEASMAAARRASDDNNWQLLSDSSWPGYSQAARDVMEGYLVMGAELGSQLTKAPSHVFLQAGVGGLASAAAAMCRYLWQDKPEIIVVEPSEAPCLIDSIEAGKPVEAKGRVSNMGRLDCKEPSHLALRYLSKEADYFMTIDDQTAAEACQWLADQDLTSTPSGIAGIAGLKALRKAGTLNSLTANSVVLTFMSEEAAGDG